MLLRIDLTDGTVVDAVTFERVGVVTPTRDPNPEHVQISVPASGRGLLEAFLKRLERTGALSCPAADLKAAVDDTLKEKR